MVLGFHLAAPLAPPPHYIGGQGAVLVDLGGVESLWDSYSQRESFPPGDPPPRRIAILLGVGFLPYFAPPTPWTTWGSLGGLLPRLGAWGSEWYCPEPSRSFQDLTGPSGIVSGHSGTFWSTSKTFRDRSRTFWSHPDSFQDHPSYGLSHPMTTKVVGTPSDYPETIPVDPGLPQYHSHMFRKHLGLLQSDPDISLNTHN